MAKAKKQLQTVCETPPTDLVKYFDTFDFKSYKDSIVGLLRLADAVTLSETFQGFHPVASDLSLVFLDDANTSNHHAYITTGPLTGNILYLSHDGESRVVFATLADFLKTVKAAHKSETFLDETHPTTPIISEDQAGVSQTVRDLLTIGDERANAVMLVYIAVMDLRDLELLTTLAKHEDFYVGEALGNALTQQPRADLDPIAKQVAKHPHFQANEAGKRAVAAIKALAKKTTKRKQ